MDTYSHFDAGMNAFAQQFRAQVANAGVPTSEHAIHFCLALAFQAAYDLAPGAVVFERPTGSGRLDLWFIPFDLVVEVKFRRPIPSGRSQPATAQFGGLLADFNKVERFPAGRRMVLYVSDRPGVQYLERSGRGLLPMTLGSSVEITVSRVATLPDTAAREAIKDGPWTSLNAELVWQDLIDEWHLLAWEVATSPEFG
jgi:hypothetical protein